MISVILVLNTLSSCGKILSFIKLKYNLINKDLAEQLRAAQLNVS